MIDRSRPSDLTENKSGTGSWRFAIPRMKKKYGDNVGPSGDEPYTEAPPAVVPSRGRTREVPGVPAPYTGQKARRAAMRRTGAR